MWNLFMHSMSLPFEYNRIWSVTPSLPLLLNHSWWKAYKTVNCCSPHFTSGPDAMQWIVTMWWQCRQGNAQVLRNIYLWLLCSCNLFRCAGTTTTTIKCCCVNESFSKENQRNAITSCHVQTNPHTDKRNYELSPASGPIQHKINCRIFIFAEWTSLSP